MTTRSIIPNLAEKEVWFLTGSQDLYGEETLRQVAEQSQEVARALGAASDIPVTIVWKPVLKSSDAIRRMALEVNAAENVIGVIAWMHTFSPAKMWIAGLDALRKPLLHLHTQANVALPWGEIDFDFMNLNQAAHGDREFGYIQTRLGVARKTVVGHTSNLAVVDSIATWTRAAAGWDAKDFFILARKASSSFASVDAVTNAKFHIPHSGTPAAGGLLLPATDRNRRWQLKQLYSANSGQGAAAD